ncbi:unnamed protein product [Menidia menidia]|uniref:DNA-directed RNA polymerase subunit n=1 Tax=Menidia menidia TaxID=238744 RepID=A0A8S4AM80_9TELE|nr:unnamed protein product [Menidia menidia]
MAEDAHAENGPKHVKMSGGDPAGPVVVSPDQETPAADGAAAEVPCAIPSFAAASELVPAAYSCLVTSAHRRHVALPPVYLNKKKTGIKEELEGELLKYSQRLNGVPLAYDSIKIVGKHGNIHDDSGYIHMDIEANFIIFQPRKGQKLLGRVNKLGVSHVGCLVHGCFNASIPKPGLVSVETWRDAGPRIGAELEFEVTTLDADAAGVLLIRGRLERTRVQELLSIGESSELSSPTDQPEGPVAELPENPPDDPPRKKKKKKKDKVKEEEMEEEIKRSPPDQPDCDAAAEPTETNGSEPSERKKKKKKKKEKEKDVKEEEQDMEVCHVEIQGSDSSGYFSDKPSKKRKHDSSGLTDATPTKSKKRKGDVEQFA